MTDSWSLSTCTLPAFKDGEWVNHLGWAIWFGGNVVACGIDRDGIEIGFLVEAANEKMAQPGYWHADGRAT